MRYSPAQQVGQRDCPPFRLAKSVFFKGKRLRYSQSRGRPLTVTLGALKKEQERVWSGGRVRGNVGLWRCGRGSLRLHHAAVLGLRCGWWRVGLFQPAGVPSGRGASRFGAAAPFGFCHGFRQLRPIHVFGWVVGEVSSQPRPNPALKGTRGYALACFPLLPSALAP